MPASAYPSDERLIVGRERERQRLRAGLDRLRDGHGALLLVSGEAGIGKTTLIDELKAEATSHGTLVLHGGCYDLTTTAPYAPWSEALRRYAPADGAPPVPAWFTDPAALQAIGSQTALFDETRRFVAELAAYQPVVIVLEDLHWSDLASLEALRYLGRELAEHAVLLVVSYRDDELTRRHELFQLLPLLVRESRAQRVHLGRLEREPLHQLIQSSYALADVDSARLTEYVWQRSEGNPFFTSELLQGLEDERVVVHTDQGWALGDLTRVDIPPLLRQVLTAQLDRLRAETRTALQIAAVIGQEVSVDVWRAVAELSEADLDQVLTEALDARMLQETYGGAALHFRHALLREALYTSLIASRRRVLHRRIGETLADTPRPDPDAVAHHFREGGDPRAVSWLIRAGVRARGSYALRIAAAHFEQAQTLLESDPEAVQHRGWLHFAIGHLLRYGDTAQSVAHLEEASRLAGAANDPVLLAHSQQILGLLRCFDGDVGGCLVQMEAANGTMGRATLNDRERARKAIASLFPEEHFGDPRASAGGGLTMVSSLPGVNFLTHTYVMWLANAGRFGEAMRLGEQYVTSVAGLTEDELLVQDICRDAYYGLGHAATMLGEPEAARKWWSVALAAYEAVGHHALVSGLQWSITDFILTYDTERVADRRRAAEAALAAATRSGGIITANSARGGVLDLIEGRWAQVHALTLRLLEDRSIPVRELRLQLTGFLGRAQGDRHLTELAWSEIRGILIEGQATEPGMRSYKESTIAQRLAATLALDAGEHAQARAWLEMHDHWLAWSGAVLGQAEGRLLWARYHLELGELEQAHEHARAALEQASNPRQPLWLIAAHRLLGRLATRRGAFEEAAQHLSTALDSAVTCELPFEIALVHLAQGEFAIATHQAESARELLAAVRAVCEPLDAQRALAQVTELEAQLSSAARRTRYPAGLTQREVDVLRLVAGGLTDAEVADQLYLSPRTVSSYLSSVFNKLGVNSRTAAAAFAIREGLV